MSTSVKVAALPNCDICKHPVYGCGLGEPARFDAKTKEGPWAYLCPRHFKEWRFFALLGTGRGQLLLLEGETEAEVMAKVAPLVV